MLLLIFAFCVTIKLIENYNAYQIINIDYLVYLI